MYFYIIFSFILWWIYDFFKFRGRAPGPLRFPIIGNIPQILLAHPKFIHLAYEKFKKQYGDIVLVKLGAKEMVLLNSYKVAKDLMKREELNARETPETILLRTNQEEIGIAFCKGELSNASRKFLMSAFSENGYGNRLKREADLAYEGEELVKYIRNLAGKNKGQIFIEGLFNISAFNLTLQLFTGERRPLDDKELHDFAQQTKKYAETCTFAGSIGMIFPFTKYFFDGLKSARIYNNLANTFILDTIKKIRARGPITDPKCVLERYVMEVDKNMEEGAKNMVFQEEHMRVTILDAFQGAIESSATTLEWTILYLIHYPEIQEKLHEEIDNLIGKDGKISFTHKTQMPYTQATILEALRMCPVFPFLLPRRNTSAISYNGFKIDKDTCIIPNGYTINRDESNWKNPNEFQPERFFDKSGNVMKNPPIITFGSGNKIIYRVGTLGTSHTSEGKKSCLGEHLAMDILFFLFSSFIQKFKFEKIPNKPLPSLDPILGLNFIPQPFKVLITNK